MQNVCYYNSPLGKILIATDDLGLIGLWFEGQKYFGSTLSKDFIEKDNEILKSAKKWLDIYFNGKNPDFSLPLHFIGSDFRLKVWHLLSKIPYGEIITYKEIAAEIAIERGVEKMSSQAVGGAIGHNPVSIIVPCHRVISTNCNLTGYAAGVDKKIKLLQLDGVDIERFILPRVSF